MFTAQGTPHRIHSWNPYGVLIDDERRWRATRKVTSAFLEHPATRVTHGVIGQVREVQYGRPQNANLGDRCRQWNLRRDELVFGSSAKPVSVPTPRISGQPAGPRTSPARAGRAAFVAAQPSRLAEFGCLGMSFKSAVRSNAQEPSLEAPRDRLRLLPSPGKPAP